jgi:hypothetical protein
MNWPEPMSGSVVKLHQEEWGCLSVGTIARLEKTEAQYMYLQRCMIRFIFVIIRLAVFPPGDGLIDDTSRALAIRGYSSPTIVATISKKPHNQGAPASSSTGSGDVLDEDGAPPTEDDKPRPPAAMANRRWCLPPVQVGSGSPTQTGSSLAGVLPPPPPPSPPRQPASFPRTRTGGEAPPVHRVTIPYDTLPARQVMGGRRRCIASGGCEEISPQQQPTGGSDGPPQSGLWRRLPPWQWAP